MDDHGREQQSSRPFGGFERSEKSPNGGALDVLHFERFVNKPPTEVYTASLDAGSYLCSIRSMYWILANFRKVCECRNQLRHPAYKKPELSGTVPKPGLVMVGHHQAPRPSQWTYFYLYVIKAAMGSVGDSTLSANIYLGNTISSWHVTINGQLIGCLLHGQQNRDIKARSALRRHKGLGWSPFAWDRYSPDGPRHFNAGGHQRVLE